MDLPWVTRGLPWCLYWLPVVLRGSSMGLICVRGRPWVSSGLSWSLVGSHLRPGAPMSVHESPFGAHESLVRSHWLPLAFMGVPWISRGRPSVSNGSLVGSYGRPWVFRGLPWLSAVQCHSSALIGLLGAYVSPVGFHGFP